MHEYLVDQANLRGFLGAYSARGPRGTIDPELSLEDIVVGLLQPHAPAEVRIIKLVVRILQHPALEVSRLLFYARRERALDPLAWIVAPIPDVERTATIDALTEALAANPPRAPRPPSLRYDPSRLIRKRARP